jgi:hypothetical protein
VLGGRGRSTVVTKSGSSLRATCAASGRRGNTGLWPRGGLQALDVFHPVARITSDTRSGCFLFLAFGVFVLSVGNVLRRGRRW